MTLGDIELRHIVDVDGQLIGIDAEVVDVPTLLRRARLGAGRRVFLNRAGERKPVHPRQLIHLTPHEVLFFETTPTAIMPAEVPGTIRLAA